MHYKLPPVLWRSSNLVQQIGGLNPQQVEWKTPPTLAPLPASLLYSATAFSVCRTLTSTPFCFTKSRVEEGTWERRRQHKQTYCTSPQKVFQTHFSSSLTEKMCSYFNQCSYLHRKCNGLHFTHNSGTSSTQPDVHYVHKYSDCVLGCERCQNSSFYTLTLSLCSTSIFILKVINSNYHTS